MKTLEIAIEGAIPTDVGIEIAKRACYCDQLITSCRFIEAGGILHIELQDNANLEDVEIKARKLVAKMKSGRLQIKPEIIRQRDTTRSSLFAATGADYTGLYRQGLGTMARGEEFLEILARIDRLFQRLGVEHFGAVPQEYNVLIPTDWLRKAGYLSSFPHSLTFAIHLKEDYDAIARFSERHAGLKELNLDSIDEFETPEYCLSPAVCYHTYGLLSSTHFTPDDNGLKVFTAVNRCFRYESKNMANVERLWEFSMREIVLVGERDRVLKERERGLDMIWKMVEMFDLTAFIETAVDPFFTSDFQSKRFFQLANQLKYELRMPVRDNDTIAVGSFNYHEDFFGDRFGIQTSDGSRVHTGCIAFGLERFVHAVLLQLGVEETRSRLQTAEQLFFAK